MPWDHCDNKGLLDDAPCPSCGASRGVVNVARGGGRFTLRMTRHRALKLRMLDRAGDPVAGEPFSVELPGGTTSEGSLDEKGQARIPSGKGQAKITWPNRLPADFLPPPAEEGTPPPDPAPKDEAEETDDGGARFTREVGPLQTFCVKPRLRVKVVDEKGSALGDTRYLLALGGGEAKEERQGRTDGQGLIDQELPDGARAATLTVYRTDKPELAIKLVLGGLSGLETLSGAQARLNALGFDCGKVDDARGPKVATAVVAFQKKHELPPTGQLDEQTRNKLREAYGL